MAMSLTGKFISNKKDSFHIQFVSLSYDNFQRLERNFRKEGASMKTSTKDQVEGKLHKMKGEIKETVGKLINDSQLKAEGSVEKIEGKAQEKVGQIKKSVEK